MLKRVIKGKVPAVIVVGLLIIVFASLVALWIRFYFDPLDAELFAPMFIDGVSFHHCPFVVPSVQLEERKRTDHLRDPDHPFCYSGGCCRNPSDDRSRRSYRNRSLDELSGRSGYPVHDPASAFGG